MIRVSNPATIAVWIFISLLAFSGSLSFAQDTKSSAKYTSPNRIFSINIPRAPNFAGVPYNVTALDTMGDKQYDKVMFHADDFGQYLVIGVRVLSAPSITAMDSDEPQTVLKNISEAAIRGWRTDLDVLPEIARESLIDTKFGKAIIRVYRARKGSILVKAQGRQAAKADAFDTNIACIVARQGALVVFVLAENDADPDNSDAVAQMATELFQDIRVLTAH